MKIMQLKILKRYNFFVVLIILGLVSLIPIFSNYQDLFMKNRQIKKRMGQLNAENRILFERQHKLQTDPVFVESVARKELNVAKEGEVVYKLSPEE